MTTDNFNIILHANSSNQESQRIDSLDGIVKKGDEFIKKVVENSYFFDNIIVKERQNLLSELRHQNIGIPARKTTKNAKNPDYWHSEDKGNHFYEQQGGIKIPIKIDYDGNKAVRDLIKDYTGYTIGAGKNSDFQNYVISHIWGRAYDPRYFTSLWNIVIIPAWANFLMDKRSPESGSIASKLQATIKAICLQLYFQDANDYTGLDNDVIMTIINSSDDVVMSKYTINVLCKKMGEQKG